jgi:uncharacterized protein with PQ loop repeat
MHWSLSLSSLVGAVGTVLAFLTVVPQARKLRRTTSAAGVSIAALANSIVSGIGWTYFGFVQHDIWVALPAAVTVPPAMYASLRAYGGGGNRERLWLPLLWAAVVTTSAVSAMWLGDGPITLTLGLSIAFMIGPAAWTVWTSADLTAVSKSAWYWLIAEAGLTGAYGYLAQVDANLLYATIAIVGSVFILGRVATAERTRERLAATRMSLGWDGCADVGSPGPGDGECGARTPSKTIPLPSLDLVAHQA